MAARTVVGLIYHLDENWIAGAYYIENLIHALSRLPEDQQPALKVYSTSQKEFDDMANRTRYPSIQWAEIRPPRGFARIINGISTRVIGSPVISAGADAHVDLIFPNAHGPYFESIKHKLFWIPDFQEKHYPKFFTAQQLEQRKQANDELAKASHPIVFSSEHARNDFQALYPSALNPQFVMPFAVTLPDIGSINPEALKKKFDLPDVFFICSNQFWAHKNHSVVIRAIEILKNEGLNVTVAFTGKPYDNRNPDYYDSLLAEVEQRRVSIRFLGFIPRVEQLALMKAARAIIQPSLFEGWSTVVEDGKALRKDIIVSDIPVHREQLPGHDAFFEPTNEHQLATLIKRALHHQMQLSGVSYDENVREFGRTFIKIVDAIAK